MIPQQCAGEPSQDAVLSDEGGPADRDWDPPLLGTNTLFFLLATHSLCRR